MHRLFLLFFLLATHFAFAQEIRSVYLAPIDNELALPIIHIGDPNESTSQLLLRFDILSPETQNLRYRFRHCDRHGQPDDLDPSEFFTGPNDEAIVNYQLSFTTLIDYTNYYQQIPNPYGHFIASGNYLLEVYPEGQEDSILLSKHFFVVEDAVDIQASIDRPRSSSGHFATHQELSVAITPHRNAFLMQQADYYTVIATQNRRTDIERVLPHNSYSGNSILYQWQPQNVFPAGNHFRYFDLSNLRTTMYNVQRIEMLGDQILAFLKPDESRSRKPYTQYNSLNGGMKTNIRDRNNPHIEADYVWVNFSLPMERPFLDGSLHIVGQLTDWRLDDSSRMLWRPEYKTYTFRLLLKQGYYSYQILFLPSGDTTGQTAPIEGDHFEMPNHYFLRVYYHAPGSRYDRLLAADEL